MTNLPYPEFTEESIDLFETIATESERLEAESYFLQRTKHLRPTDKRPRASVSLFCSPPDPILKPPNVPEDLDKIHPSIRRGEQTWYEAFYNPLVKHISENSGFCVRVHLSRNLQFLSGALTNAGSEVIVMERDSIFHNPGAMWRFLVADEPGCWAVSDAEDLGHLAEQYMPHYRTFWDTGNDGFFRFMGSGDVDELTTTYRPFAAGVLSGRTPKSPPWQISRALPAWLWFHQKNLLNVTHQHPILGTRTLFGMDEPLKYGGDEQFIGQYMFRKLIRLGMLETRCLLDRAHLHPMAIRDLHQVVTSHPRGSESIHFST